MNKSIIELLANYKKSNHITAGELPVVERFLQLLKERPACFGRQPGGHITASAWIINTGNNAALLTHHKKLNRWLQLGGHCDDNTDVASGAVREAQEESGIEHFSFIIPAIFDIDIHAIPNACKYHYDVRFLLEPSHDNFLVSAESHNLAWVPYDKIEEFTQEESVIRMNKKYREKFI